MAVRDRIICLVLRFLRVPCGEHGGGDDYVGRGRWCLKPFGHDDSCAFDVVRQPLWQIRRRCRGWKDVDGVVRSGHPLDSDDRQGAPVKGDTT